MYRFLSPFHQFASTSSRKRGLASVSGSPLPFLPRTVRDVLRLDPSSSNGEIEVCGWVRTVRAQKKIGFVELGDGSSLDGLQCVVADTDLVKRLSTGMSVKIRGALANSPAKGQKMELKVTKCEILGDCDPAVGEKGARLAWMLPETRLIPVIPAGQNKV